MRQENVFIVGLKNKKHKSTWEFYTDMEITLHIKKIR